MPCREYRLRPDLVDAYGEHFSHPDASANPELASGREAVSRLRC